MRSSPFLFLCAAVVAAPLCAAPSIATAPPVADAPAAPLATVPLVNDAGRLIVKVAVAGHDSLDFILDTAAGASVVSPDAVRLLGIDSTAIDQVTVEGASGAARFSRVALGRVAVGGQTVDGIRAVVTDVKRFRRSTGPAYHGILGNDYLRNFDVELDVAAGRMRLYRKGTAPEPAGGVWLPNVTSDDGFAAVDLAMGATVVRAVLDTGAPRSTLNPLADAASPAASYTDASRSGGMSNHRMWLRSRPLGTLRAGTMELALPQVLTGDLPVFGALGWTHRPAMILGVDVLASYRVLISYGTGRVNISAPSTT